MRILLATSVTKRSIASRFLQVSNTAHPTELTVCYHHVSNSQKSDGKFMVLIPLAIYDEHKFQNDLIIDGNFVL